MFRSMQLHSGDKAELLSRFVRRVAVKTFHGLNDSELQQIVDVSLREWEGHTSPIPILAYIDGLSITASPLVISDGMILRWPTAEDVTETILLDEYGGTAPRTGEAWFHCIGEFTFHVESSGAAQVQLLKVLDALCLFRVGGIVASRDRTRISGLDGTIGIGGTKKRSRFTFSLEPSDSAHIDSFLDFCLPLMPDPFHVREAIDAKQIAFARYQDALFHAVSPEHTIASAVACLEALFLIEDSELRHRLCQRVAIFINRLDCSRDPEITYANVNEGYKIRSKFVHGTASKSHPKSKLDDLTPVLLHYARMCTLSFFQIRETKQFVLQYLDTTLIKPDSTENLENIMKTVVYH